MNLETKTRLSLARIEEKRNVDFQTFVNIFFGFCQYSSPLKENCIWIRPTSLFLVSLISKVDFLHHQKSLSRYVTASPNINLLTCKMLKLHSL